MAVWLRETMAVYCSKYVRMAFMSCLVVHVLDVCVCVCVGCQATGCGSVCRCRANLPSACHPALGSPPHDAVLQQGRTRHSQHSPVLPEGQDYGERREGERGWEGRGEEGGKGRGWEGRGGKRREGEGREGKGGGREGESHGMGR